jgi:SAM-dependent methyltransferase
MEMHMFSAGKTLTRLRRKKDLALILRKMDRDRLQACREKYRDISPGAFHSKWWDLRRFVGKNLYYAYWLDLHRSEPQRILDLGTGFGYFPFICNYFGHAAIGLDIDDLNRESVYHDVTEILNVERKLWKIEPHESLPDFGQKFDLITGLATQFNNPARENEWGVDEWAFFLEDLAKNQLSAEGRAFFSLIAGKSGRYYHKALSDFFAKNGAVTEGPVVYFKSMAAFS